MYASDLNQICANVIHPQNAHYQDSDGNLFKHLSFARETSKSNKTYIYFWNLIVQGNKGNISTRFESGHGKNQLRWHVLTGNIQLSQDPGYKTYFSGSEKPRMLMNLEKKIFSSRYIIIQRLVSKQCTARYCFLIKETSFLEF